MATLESRRWEGDLTGPTWSDRSPCAYEVYLPDRLSGRLFTLDGEVAASVSGAESALARVDASAYALTSSEALARLLLRAESVASSRIEGLEIGGRREVQGAPLRVHAVGGYRRDHQPVGGRAVRVQGHAQQRLERRAQGRLRSIVANCAGATASCSTTAPT